LNCCSNSHLSLFSPNALVLASNTKEVLSIYCNTLKNIMELFLDNLDPAELDAAIAAMPESCNNFDSEFHPLPLFQATEVNSEVEQRAGDFVLNNKAPVERQHSSAPTHSPFVTKTNRDGSPVGMTPTAVAGATHFYIALQLEFHYKLFPGTFAGKKGSRMTDMKPETKEIFSCLTHMMMKELR
jgi:hypothetical protein